MTIELKRAYQKATKSDGTRILVERLWPRGLSKDEARVDLWLKEAAPSTELRKWFAHDPGRWQEFRRRYHQELRRRPEVLDPLYAALEHGTVTFVYGSREQRYNAAVALRDYVEDEQ